jgi:hypothetical protein
MTGFGIASGIQRIIYVLAAVFVATWSLAAAPALSLTLDFGCISGNLANDCTIGEAQLQVDVSDNGGSQVLFLFSNNGPDDSSITDIYFDDGSLLGISTVVDDPPNVSFSVPAVPSELPSAGNASPVFVTTSGFSADADPPPSLQGVNPGETVGIIFDLIGGQDFADVLAELDSGALRIGIHVQDYASGGSESFVNVPVPEPSTAALVAMGLGLVALRRKQLR